MIIFDPDFLFDTHKPNVIQKYALQIISINMYG
jgi:hypothetical protein